MSAQQSLTFDAPVSAARKRHGMQAAAAKKNELLEQARRGLYLIAVSRPDRCVTADDAAKWMEDHGLPGLGNAAGSLFSNGEWEFTGQWVKSTRVVAHRNDIRVWRLK